MASTLQPRECIVTKQEGKSFGFLLRIEKDIIGHLIRGVEASGAAAKAGLKDGDRLLRVNGAFVDQLEHPQVVDLIKVSGNSVNLLVLDGASYENAKKKGENLENVNQNQPARGPEPSKGKVSVQKPRLCYLVKGKQGYGFSLKTTQGMKGLYITALAPDGVASKAGARDNDRLVEVNGENVENATHEQVASKVKQSGEAVVFLLVDKETDNFYSNPKKTLTGEMADLKLLPLKPRIVELNRGEEGYGFYLREVPRKKDAVSPADNIIKDIDQGSPADKSSLKDNDRLVAVNGNPVEGLKHEEIVEKIRKGESKTSLLVVDAETDRLYKMAGVSPVLYGRGEPEAAKGEPAMAAATAVNRTPAPAEAAAATRLAPPPSQAPPPIGEVHHKARYCRLEKAPTGYGFHLNAIKNMPGQFIKEVTKGGPADAAGLQNDDILIEVNGVNVETATYDDVVTRIRNAKGHLTLLVASSEAYEHFKAHNIPVTASLAEPLADHADPPAYTEVLAGKTEQPVPEPKSRASSSSSSDESTKDEKEEEDDTQL